MFLNKPFLKWAGGKFRLIPELKKYFPAKVKLYVEPFLGAGSVFLNMGEQADHLLINDINRDLMDVWVRLKHNCETFIDTTEDLFKLNTEADYYMIRDAFNGKLKEWNSELILRRAESFIYLNRHCFNGLCRYNKKGEFNVPYGKYKTIHFPREEMTAAIPLMKRTSWMQIDFYYSMMEAGRGDLIYCDPPYVPLSDTSDFTKYSSGGFTLDHHKFLVERALVASRDQGATVVVSNHDTPFTRELYRDAEIHGVEVRRSISCKGDDRKAAKEIIAVYRPK